MSSSLCRDGDFFVKVMSRAACNRKMNVVFTRKDIFGCDMTLGESPRLGELISRVARANGKINKKGDKIMKEKLQSIKEEALAQIQAADVPEKLNDVRVRFLGKKGELTAVLKGMKDVAAEERPKVGQMVNEVRQEIESILDETKK